MFSSSSSSSSNFPPQEETFYLHPSFPDDWLRHVLLFAPQHASTLATTNRQISHAMNSAGYWRQRLYRDFGMPWHYSNLATAGKKEHSFAALRTVHQRIEQVKAVDESRYRVFYKNIIIDGGIHFPPLLATGATHPVIETSMLPLYFHEAVKLGNTQLAEQALLQAFAVSKDKYASEKKEDYNTRISRPDFVSHAAIDIATETDNFELLERLQSNAEHLIEHSFRSNIKLILDSRAVLPPETKDMNAAEKASHIEKATCLLQRAIVSNLYCLAHKWVDKFLKNNIAIPQQTLAWALLLNCNSSTARLQFINRVMSLIPQHPSLLLLLSPGVFSVFIEALTVQADIELIKKIDEAARGFTPPFQPELLKKIHICLLTVAIMCGDFNCILSSQQALDHADVESLLCLATDRGQLNMTKHFIQQLDKNIPALSFNPRHMIRDCAHKKIVKYLIDEFKPSFKRPASVEEKEEKNDKRSLLNIVFSEALESCSSIWLENAIRYGKIEILHYLIKEAPENCQLRPTEDLLRQAIGSNQFASVQYLIETYGMQATIHNARHAIIAARAELAVYLLSQCLDTLSPQEFSSTTLFNVMCQVDMSNPYLNQLLAWLISPAGIEKGFQFNLSHIPQDLSVNTRFQTLAWLAAKLKIEIPSSKLESLAGSFCHLLPDSTWSLRPNFVFQVKEAKEKICVEALTSLYHQFRRELDLESTAAACPHPSPLPR